MSKRLYTPSHSEENESEGMNFDQQAVMRQKYMTMTEPIDSGKPSDNVICFRCRASLPSHAMFCSSCGEQIKKKKNEEEEAYTDNSHEVTHKQEDDDTLRLPVPDRAHVKGLRPYRLL